MAKKKATTRTLATRTEHRVKGKNELICEAIAWMNWENVHKVMEYLEWTWDDNGVPSTDDLKDKAEELMSGAYDEAVECIEVGGLTTDKTLSHFSGGLKGSVDIENGEIYDVTIEFIPESWSAEALESLTYYEQTA